MQELATNADAIARLAPAAEVAASSLSDSGDGGRWHPCLLPRLNGGHAQEPATDRTPATSGRWKLRCTAIRPSVPRRTATARRKGEVLAINIAVGIDHRVVPDADGSPGNELLDQCSVINVGQTPDTLNTFQGLSDGTAEGLATGGPLPAWIDAAPTAGKQLNPNGPRIRTRRCPAVAVHRSQPGWSRCWRDDPEFLCEIDVRQRFQPRPGLGRRRNSGSSGILQHMSRCLIDHVAAAKGPVLFLETFEAVAAVLVCAAILGRIVSNGQLGVAPYPTLQSDVASGHMVEERGNTISVQSGRSRDIHCRRQWSLVQLSGC